MLLPLRPQVIFYGYSSYINLVGILDLCLIFDSFFFSSRRRHTRLVSDWSSDVCSSDLTVALAVVVSSNGLLLRLVPTLSLIPHVQRRPTLRSSTLIHCQRAGQCVEMRAD